MLTVLAFLYNMCEIFSHFHTVTACLLVKNYVNTMRTWSLHTTWNDRLETQSGSWWAVGLRWQDRKETQTISHSVNILHDEIQTTVSKVLQSLHKGDINLRVPLRDGTLTTTNSYIQRMTHIFINILSGTNNQKNYILILYHHRIRIRIINVYPVLSPKLQLSLFEKVCDAVHAKYKLWVV